MYVNASTLYKNIVESIPKLGTKAKLMNSPDVELKNIVQNIRALDKDTMYNELGIFSPKSPGTVDTQQRGTPWLILSLSL